MPRAAPIRQGFYPRSAPDSRKDRRRRPTTTHHHWTKPSRKPHPSLPRNPRQMSLPATPTHTQTLVKASRYPLIVSSSDLIHLLNHHASDRSKPSSPPSAASSKHPCIPTSAPHTSTQNRNLGSSAVPTAQSIPLTPVSWISPARTASIANSPSASSNLAYLPSQTWSSTMGPHLKSHQLTLQKAATPPPPAILQQRIHTQPMHNSKPPSQPAMP
jgi:hypothetical protein